MINYTCLCFLAGFTFHVLASNPNSVDRFFASSIFTLCLFGIILESFIRSRKL